MKNQEYRRDPKDDKKKPCCIFLKATITVFVLVFIIALVSIIIGVVHCPFINFLK